LRVYKCGKPGTAETRFSSTFAVGDTGDGAVTPGAPLTPIPALPTLAPVVAQ